MKLLLFAILTFLTGTYLSSFLIENNSKKSIQKITKENNFANTETIKETIQVKEKKVLPNYIKEDLIENNIDVKNFSQEQWSLFLEKLEQQSFDKLNSLSNGSVIHFAAQNNSEELILKLIALGYDINEKDSYGYTPLLHAINKDTKVEYIKFLIDNGAKLNIIEGKDERDNALKLALGKGKDQKDDTNEELVNFFLENGYELNNNYFANLISINSSNKDKYLMDFIDQLEENEIIESEYSLKHQAIYGRFPSYRKSTYFERIIESADNSVISYIMNTKTNLNNYPTKENLLNSILSSKTINTDNLEKIIKSANIDIHKDFGPSPILHAIVTQNSSTIEYFVKKGFNLEYKNERNEDAYDYLNYFYRNAPQERERLTKLFNKYSTKENK